MVKRISSVTAVAAAVLLLAGCSAAPGSAATASGPQAPKSELSVFAAASLTASFGEIASEFAEQHPNITVTPVSYDGSSTLATQIIEGAPADVFASADQANMARVDDAGLVAGSPKPFATNTLEIAVAPGNPKGIHTVADLANPKLQVILCAPQVPCGAAAHKLLTLKTVSVTPASEEQNVKAVVTKVQLGEADAGLVYSTDVQAAAGAVTGVPIAGTEQAANTYQVAVLKHAHESRAAKAFVTWLLSANGQKIMASFGFAGP